MLKINKARAVIIESPLPEETTLAFAETQPVEFREKVCRMAKTANMRDVRTKITFSKKDKEVMNVVIQFVEYLTARCKR